MTADGFLRAGQIVGVSHKPWAPDGIQEAVKLCAMVVEKQYLKVEQTPGKKV